MRVDGLPEERDHAHAERGGVPHRVRRLSPGGDLARLHGRSGGEDARQGLPRAELLRLRQEPEGNGQSDSEPLSVCQFDADLTDTLPVVADAVAASDDATVAEPVRLAERDRRSHPDPGQPGLTLTPARRGDRSRRAHRTEAAPSPWCPCRGRS